jgi:hypothetical protein
MCYLFQIELQKTSLYQERHSANESFGKPKSLTFHFLETKSFQTCLIYFYQ